MNQDKHQKHEKNNCTIHVLPPSISEADINALFLGLVDVVKKKIELDYKSQLVNISEDYLRVKNELKQKSAECNRLKNEILNLKSIIERKQL